MVEHRVHHHLKAAFVALVQEPLEVLHGAEGRVYLSVVGDVVAVVVPRRVVQRRKPYGRRPELLYVVELRDDAGDIAHAVIVRIHEAERIYLINDRFFIPVCFYRHNRSFPFIYALVRRAPDHIPPGMSGVKRSNYLSLNADFRPLSLEKSFRMLMSDKLRKGLCPG